MNEVKQENELCETVADNAMEEKKKKKMMMKRAQLNVEERLAL